MIVSCIVNGTPVRGIVEPGDTLRGMLVSLGHIAVRDSDDAEGFAGSDTVLVDDRPVYANLLLAAQAEGTVIRTPDSLATGRTLSFVQQAMIDAGIVQSAYNAPAAALLLTWLLEHNSDPSREEIKDVLSGIFVRDTGYEHYFLAVQLARELLFQGTYTSSIAPEFRKELSYVGKVKPKIDGRQLVAGWKSFVEDRVEPGHAPLSCSEAPMPMPISKASIPPKQNPCRGWWQSSPVRIVPMCSICRRGRAIPNLLPMTGVFSIARYVM